MQRSVFNVAADLIRMSGEPSMSAVKLEKLVYYTFGWYGRLTSKELFGQTFYAMAHGPVVSELLAAHSKMPSVSLGVVEDVSHEFADSVQEPDPYYDAVLSAILRTYGTLDPWRLRDVSHEEVVWERAWSSRGHAKRADIDREEIVDYFIRRTDVPPQLAALLPDPQHTTVEAAEFDKLDSLEVPPSEAFIRSLQAMGVA